MKTHAKEDNNLQCVLGFTTLSISTMLEADCSHEEFYMYLEKNRYFLKKPTQQFTK